MLIAASLGLVAVVATFPADFVLPRAGLDWAPLGDAAQHAIAQRYFTRAPWGWPPLFIPTLDAPRGINLAFADGIPLLALLLKTARDGLSQGFHGIGLWYAITTVAQPVAAVWALRSAGECRLLPAVGVALAALAMPAWLARYGHAALTGHFLLLLALGWYLRLAERQTLRPWLGAALTALAALLVHPYLAAMVLAVLGAAPLTLLLRGEAGWIGAGLAVAAILAAVLGTMAAFGYLGAAGDGGYGQFAMNLLSPVWPYRSLLLPGIAGTEIDATGKGGWEGYNWLGAGLLAGLLAALLLAPRAAIGALGRHTGLVLVLLGLVGLAVSQRVGLGGSIVLDLGPPPAAMEQFRASGRFFWPIAYALLIGAAALLARLPGGAWLVLGLGLLQTADTLPIRADLAAWARARPAWVLDAEALRPMLKSAGHLTLLPSWPCIPPGAEATFIEAHQALALASETALPVSTMHVARWAKRPVCDDRALAAAPFVPGELRLILPAALPDLLHLVPEAELRCRMVGIAMACVDPPLPSLPSLSPPSLSPPAPAAEAAPEPEPPGPDQLRPEPPAPRPEDSVPPDKADGASSR